jgi:curved DNA-binding protein
MAQEKDLYRILGVSKSASEEEIKAAYKKLVRKYHPDLNPGDKAAEDKFKEVAVAFEVLGDKKKRQLYDDFGMAGIRPGFNEEQARAYQQWGGGGGQPFGDMFGGGGGFGGSANFDLGSLFEQFFGGGGGMGSPGGGYRPPRPTKGQDIEQSITIDFLDAVLGAKKELTLSKLVNSGSGFANKRSTLTVTIPPGVDEDSKIRLSGQGHASRNGGAAGDLFLQVKVRSHDYFTRDGKDIHLEVPITAKEAYSGGSIDIPILTGSVTLRLRGNVQSGQKMRLRGKGVPGRKGKADGDLIVTLSIKMPETDQPEGEELLEKLDALYKDDVRGAFQLEKEEE